MVKSSTSILLIVCVVLFVVGGFFYLNNITGNIILADYSITEYAPPYNILKDNASIFNITPEQIDGFADEIINIEANVSMPGGYVYKKGYIFNYNSGQWEVFNFDQTAVGSSYWIKDFASVDLIINSSRMLTEGENYIVAYACEKVDEEWKCGCNSPTSCEKWMLQIFNVTNISNPAVPTSCTSDDNCSVMDVCDSERKICVANVTIEDIEPPMFAGGTGTLANPYQIATWGQLNNTHLYLNANYSLIRNLSSSDEDYAGIGDDWTPIGTSYPYSCQYLCEFKGNFEGNGNTISDLIINNPGILYYVGLFGSVYGNISDIGLINVNIHGSSHVGGLVGYQFSGTITNSYSVGAIYSSDYTGGLVGINNGAITNSYSAGTVETPYPTGPYAHLGGLVGQSQGVITNCYSTGDVTGYGLYVGGLVGWQESGTISNSYSRGHVIGAFTMVGGLVGYQFRGPITSSFWDINVSGQTNGCGPPGCAGATGKTTEQMKNQTVFINAGWDFTNVWAIDSLKNNGYPYFRWQSF